MVTITYCSSCGYKSRAVRAAKLLQEKLGLTAELKAGWGGVFEIAVDGKVVARRGLLLFPDESEILSSVADAAGKR